MCNDCHITDRLGGSPVNSGFLTGYQRDIESLRKVAAASSSRIYLREATIRMMAGAAPGRTQRLLLDRTMVQKSGSNKGLICKEDLDPNGDEGGERERANALYMACRHLPPQLLSVPGERAGMLAEAAKTLEKIGDKKALQECYKLMRSIGSSSATIQT